MSEEGAGVVETDDRVEAIPEFLDWLKQHGVIHPKIGLEVQGANNLCLVTVDDIHDGDDVVKVPVDELINVFFLKRLWPELADFDPTSIGADMYGLIYVFLATEQKRPNTPYAPLFRMFPKPGTIGTPMSYSEEHLALLKSTNLYETVLKIKGRLHKLADYYPKLQEDHKELFGGISCSFEELVWALEVFWSRAFGVMIEGEQVASLVPLCGMSNHSAEAMVSYVTDVEHGYFCLRSNMEVASGQQFYNNYRHRSNEKLLLNYGFVCENNPLDAFTVKVSLMSDDPLYSVKAQLLVAHNIGWDHYLTLDKDCPIPDSLIDCLRILSLDETEAYFWKDSMFGNMVSERNEIETLRVLAKLLTRQYDRLLFKDIDGDMEMVKKLAEEGTDYGLYCIYSYRLGQAMILKHSMEYAQALYDRAIQTISWKPQFIIGVRCDGGLAAFNEMATRTQVFRNVQYSEEDESGEIRLVTTAPVHKGDVIISVPANVLIGPSNIDSFFKTPTFSEAAHKQDDFAVSASIMLARPNFSSSEYLLAFYKCIPKEINSPVYMEPEDMENYLGGTPLLSYALEMRNRFKSEYDALCKALKELQPRRSARSAAVLNGRSPLPWNIFVWSRLMAEARLMEGENGDPVFVPLPFLPRHSPYHMLDKQYDPATKSFVVRAVCDVKTGQEIFDSVGSDQSFDHFLRYGFLLFQNPADFQEISLVSPVNDVEQTDDSEVTERRMAALEQLHLLGNQQDAIDHYLQADHFPEKLYDHMRVIAMTPEEIENLIACEVTNLSDALSEGQLQLCDETRMRAAQSLNDVFDSLASDITVLDEDAFAKGLLKEEPLNRAVAAYLMRQKRIVDDTIAKLVDIDGDLLMEADATTIDEGEEEEEEEEDKKESGDFDSSCEMEGNEDDGCSSANHSTSMENESGSVEEEMSDKKEEEGTDTTESKDDESSSKTEKNMTDGDEEKGDSNDEPSS